MQGKRIGGRFIILPCEVLDILYQLPERTRIRTLSIYVGLLNKFAVIEDWESEGDWITGKIKASKNEIADKIKMTRAEFYDKSQERAWQVLISTGLIIDSENDEIFFTKLRRKIDSAVSPAQIKELENRIKVLESLLKAPDDDPPESESQNQDENSDEENIGTDFANKNENDPSRIKNDPSRIKNDPSRIISSRTMDQGPGSQIRRLDDEDAKICNIYYNEKKEFIKKEIANLWPMRGYKAEVDDEIIDKIKNFTNDKISEAFAAAKRSRVAGGHYNWILNRLEHPEEYKKYSRGRNYKNGKSGGGKINIGDAGKKGKGEILGLECDWLKNN